MATWSLFAKLTTYLSGRKVGTQPGQANINAELDNVYLGINAAGQAVVTHSTSTDHDGRYYTETEIDGKVADLAGTGRTTETIKGAFESLEIHKTSIDHDARYPTRTDMSAAISNAALGVQSGGVTTDLPGANAHLTHRQGGVDKFRYELDGGGNLIRKRWTGAAWVETDRVSTAGTVTAPTFAATTATVTQLIVNGATYYGRLPNASTITAPVGGDSYFDTALATFQQYTGSAWQSFGFTTAQVQAIARTEALKLGGA